MPGAMPLPSGAFCVRGAFAALAAFDVFRDLVGLRPLRLGAALRAVLRAAFRATLRRVVRGLGFLLMRRATDNGAGHRRQATGDRPGLRDSTLKSAKLEGVAFLHR